MLQINNRRDFDAWLIAGGRPSAAIQGIDLRENLPLLKNTDLSGSIFLSCNIAPDMVGEIVKHGAIVIPDSPKYIFHTHKSTLYSVDELFAGYNPSDPLSYENSFDHKVYQEYKKDGALNLPLDTRLFRRLHDHSITNALFNAIDNRKVVAIMGGHGMERQDAYYALIAKLSRQLTLDGYLMVSGGGPGAMEATHLGAYFASYSEPDLIEAIHMIKPRPEGAEPNKEYKDPDWLARAWRVREKYPLDAAQEKKSMSIGIPTWFYGHEPPAAFATHIAKYFANSIREDGLLMIAQYGVIFSPGNAGTRQEIFQDAAQNHYGTSGYYSPMILLGTDYWTGQSKDQYSYPVWQLLQETASPNYKKLMSITDDPADIIKQIKSYNPAEHMKPSS